MNQQSTIGTRIRDARKEAGLTQAGLASSVGRSQNTISDWERGVATPGLDEIFELSKSLEVNPAWITGWTERRHR